ncbi:MAG: hypothetical protein U9O06_06130 [Euryarchaeota archaeon]|nr:hypothetical protein [Euryarchaeota archaeon]
MGGIDGSSFDGLDDRDYENIIESVDKIELTATFTDDLWLDRLARKFGFGRLAELLPGEIPPSYVYAAILIVTLETILNGRAYLLGQPVVYLRNPFFIFQPLALLTAVYGSRALRARYKQVMKEMDIERRANDPGLLINIVPNWLPWALFSLLFGMNLVRIISLGGPTAIYQQQGLSSLLGWIVANPIWASIATQFIAVYLAIVLLAPWRLWKSDVGIDFLDPEGLGGLRPLGELIKHAYYYLAAGLIAFALLLYTPGISSPELERTVATNVSFTVAWVSAVATVSLGVFILHHFMRQEKRRELHRLKKIKQQHIQNPWDIGMYSISQGKEEFVADITERMTKVNSTNEYPATFSIWSQLLFSIVVPKAAQLLIASI